MSDVASPASGTKEGSQKAYISTAVSFVGALCTAYLAGDPNTLGEWLSIFATAFATGGLTYGVKNKPKKVRS